MALISGLEGKKITQKREKGTDKRGVTYRMGSGNKDTVFIIQYLWRKRSDNQIHPGSCRVVFGDYHFVGRKALLVQIQNCWVTEVEPHWIFAQRPAIKQVIWPRFAVGEFGHLKTDFKRFALDNVIVPADEGDIPWMKRDQLFIWFVSALNGEITSLCCRDSRTIVSVI